MAEKKFTLDDRLHYARVLRALQEVGDRSEEDIENLMQQNMKKEGLNPETIKEFEKNSRHLWPAAAEGATFNMADEIAGAVGSTGIEAAQGTRIADKTELSRMTNPKMTMAAEIGGSLPVSGGLAGAAMKQGVKGGANAITRAMRAAGVGGTASGLDTALREFGQSEGGFSERAQNIDPATVGMNTAMGAGLSAIGPAVLGTSRAALRGRTGQTAASGERAYATLKDLKPGTSVFDQSPSDAVGLMATFAENSGPAVAAQVANKATRKAKKAHTRAHTAYGDAMDELSGSTAGRINITSELRKFLKRKTIQKTLNSISEDSGRKYMHKKVTSLDIKILDALKTRLRLEDKMGLSVELIGTVKSPGWNRVIKNYGPAVNKAKELTDAAKDMTKIAKIAPRKHLKKMIEAKAAEQDYLQRAQEAIFLPITIASNIIKGGSRPAIMSQKHSEGLMRQIFDPGMVGAGANRLKKDASRDATGGLVGYLGALGQRRMEEEEEKRRQALQVNIPMPQ